MAHEIKSLQLSHSMLTSIRDPLLLTPFIEFNFLINSKIQWELCVEKGPKSYVLKMWHKTF